MFCFWNTTQDRGRCKIAPKNFVSSISNLPFCAFRDNVQNLANFIKQNNQQNGKIRNKRKGPKFEPKDQNPKWGTKGQWNKSCSTIPTNHKKHIRKKKGWKT